LNWRKKHDDIKVRIVKHFNKIFLTIENCGSSLSFFSGIVFIQGLKTNSLFKVNHQKDIEGISSEIGKTNLTLKLL